MSSVAGTKYLQPVKLRAPLTTVQKINTFNFFFIFNLGILIINITQFLLLPFAFIPSPFASAAYQDGIRYTKGALGNLLSPSPLSTCMWPARVTTPYVQCL
jgi:hypothetical protein